MTKTAMLLTAMTLLVGIGGTGRLYAADTLTPVPIVNGSFDQGSDATGLPQGWSRYAGSQTATATVAPEGKALLLDDQDEGAECGVVQNFPLGPGLGYEVSVKVKAFEGRPTAGAFLQFRFLPSGQFQQCDLTSDSTTEFQEVTLRGFAPPATTGATIYLYSHRDVTPKVMVTDVKVVSGVTAPPPPPPDPEPPVYDKLKDLHLSIALAADGKPACSIVAPARYAVAATALQAAIQKRCGVKLPIIADTDPGAATPFVGNLIILGNRSTSKTSSELYDRYYSLMDLKYPGPKGYSVRSLHNPYGNDFSAVLVGGSDDEGVAAGAKAFADSLASAPAAPGKLAVGWTMLTKLGEGVQVPTDLRQFETWEASAGYGSSGYFGWCSLSKRAAMYYMTGDPFQAREFYRLAFPDAQAIKEIEQIDDERVENKKDPLAGPYHYNAMMLILYWDLIEESPVFTDAERLKVTNAFARRLDHLQDKDTYAINGTPSGVSSRHGQWSALSLYTLGRYFNKYYPSPLWAQAERAGGLAFSSLHQHAWLAGENDNLYWYCTGIAPTITYLVLSGDRKPMQNGVFQKLLKGQEVLVSGRLPDYNLRYAALDFLNKTAYLTGDGRWLTYRQRTQLNTDTFRLGQSFWPDANLTASAPSDLCGKWTVHEMPRPMWLSRGAKWPLAQSFMWMSYRSAPDAGGDFVLIDGFNGASRNPYHTYDLLELRLGGKTLLSGYMNQVLTSADGMVEPLVPMDGQLLHQDVVGRTALAVGQVPGLPFCNWKRTLAQRTGQYALIVDDITFEADSDNMKVNTTWQPVSGVWNPKTQAIRVQTDAGAVNLPGWVSYRAMEQKCQSQPADADSMISLDSVGIMLLRAKKPGGWIEMAFKTTSELSGEAWVDLVSYNDRGTVRFFLDGKPLGEPFDHWSESVQNTRAPLGQIKLPAGDHVLRAEPTAPHPGNDRCYVGLMGLSVKTPQAQATPAAAAFYELRASDVQDTQGGGVVHMNWVGAVKKGDQRHAFYLIAQNTEAAAQPLACVQIAPNAAALGLPAPAVAVSGEYRSTKADLALLAADHAFGHNVTSLGLDKPLLTADVPVDLEWDLTSGALTVVAAKPAQLQVGDTKLSAPAGRTNLTQKPAPVGLAEALGVALAAGQKQRTDALVALAKTTPATYPQWPTVATADIGDRVTKLEVLTGTTGPQVAVVDDKVIHILTPDGKAVRRLETEAKILSVRWWEKYQLLLVGCFDDKLIAFDQSGNRKWVFTSVMDQAVYEAAKTYWFKTAPGHEGVRGLFTGAFLDGKEQAFVGGACTLEIVDENGQLVRRTPFFWGPGTLFQLVPQTDGSTNLLIAREPGDGFYCWVYNNQTGAKTQGFHLAPSGHSYVPGWMDMSRDHLFVADLEGDGKQEVISEVNGVWNRVSVWNVDGAPLYNAQFGAGLSWPNRNIRGLGLLDLNADGKLEIVTATSAGLIVALDSQCRKLWSAKLPSPALCLRTVPAAEGRGPQTVVGCEDGSVLSLDGTGKIIRAGKLDSAANKMEGVLTPAGPRIMVGTSKGQVATFAP